MRAVIEGFDCILGSLSLGALVTTLSNHVVVNLTRQLLSHHVLVGAPYLSEVLVLKLEHVHFGNRQVESIFTSLLLLALFDNLASLIIGNSLNLVPIGDAFFD